MKQCIFEIRYEFRWQSAEPTHWDAAVVRVCSGPDAVEAVEKARKAALALHRLDENGKEERCTGFRLREVLLAAEADL
jgi:hypothetical protein